MKIDSAIFYTTDIERAIDFYKNKVGFELEYQNGSMYVSFMFEDGVRLGIKTKTEEREIPGHQTLIVKEDDIESRYAQVKKNGIEIHKDLTDEPWGIHFNFLDPDGNKIEFIKRK